MSGRYAERTTVSTQASRADIERTLEKYGATAFVSGWDQRQHISTIMFDIAHRRIRFILPLPDPASPEFTPPRPAGQDRSPRGVKSSNVGSASVGGHCCW